MSETARTFFFDADDGAEGHCLAIVRSSDPADPLQVSIGRAGAIGSHRAVYLDRHTVAQLVTALMAWTAPVIGRRI